MTRETEEINHRKEIAFQLFASTEDNGHCPYIGEDEHSAYCAKGLARGARVIP